MTTRVARGLTGSLRIAVIGTALLASGATAQAQSSADKEHGQIGINFGEQLRGDDINESVDFTYIQNTGRFRTHHEVSHGHWFDVAGAVRLWRNLGAGIAFSKFRKSDSGSFDISVPHPSPGNPARTASGRVGDIEREENAVHFQAVYFAPIGAKVRVLLSAGPTVFRARQDLIESVGFFERPPFDELPDLQARVLTFETGTKVGVNVGADVTYMIGRRWGVGGLVRWSTASADVTLDPDDGAPFTARTISLDLGGLQLGAGLRIGF